jgi:peptidyl-prolyl cis-trans isomerase D
LLQTAELQRRQILSNNPDIDPVTLDQQAIQATALQQLISQRVMLQYTQSNDLAISEAAVDQMIVQSKDFQVDGEFDRELFESLLRNFGLTPTTYRQQLKRGNLVGQVQQAVAGSAFTLEPNADLVASLDGQTRNIAVLTLPLALEMLNVSIDEQDIDTYYVDNKQRFMTPENVSVSFVMLNKSHFYDLVEVTDEDLKNAYLDAQQTALQKSEVEASHLLFLVNDSQTEEQALALAGVAFNQLELGQDFTEVAQQHSQDDSTSSDGGYIGLLAKGEFGEAFDKVLFDLQPGTYSAPVTTEFGVQIVYAHDDAAGQPTFEEQKDALNLALKQSGAESLFVAASEEMADIAFSSPDLLEVAEALGLSVETSSPFGRQGGEDIASYDRVVAAAFADDVLLQGNNSSVLELASDKLVVIRVNQHNEPSQQPIADVKVDIVEQLVAQKSSAALDIKAKAYVEELNSGADMGSVATTENLTWQQFNNLVRGSTVVNSLLVQSAFRLPRVVSGGVSYGIAPSFTGDVSIIQLQSVTDANPEEQTPEQRLSLIEALTRMQGQGDVKLLESSLSGQAVVETF